MINTDNQPKLRKYHPKYVTIPPPELKRRRKAQDYNITRKLFMPSMMQQQLPLPPITRQRHKEKNYQGQIFELLFYLQKDAQKVIQYAKIFKEQPPGAIDKNTIKKIKQLLPKLLTNFQLNQTEQIKLDQEKVRAQIQKIQKDSKFQQSYKRDLIRRINTQSQGIFKDKQNLDNFYQLSSIFNHKIRQQRLKHSRQQTYGHIQQSIFYEMCRSYEYFVGLNNIYCDYYTIYNVHIDITFVNSFKIHEFFTQKHFDLLFGYMKQVEGINDLTRNQICLLNAFQAKQYHNGALKHINITKYNRAGILFNYDSTQWFLICVFNKQKKIIVYDSKFSHDKNYDEYIQKIQERIFQEKKGTVRYEVICDKKLQQLTQHKQDFQNGFYIIYALVCFVDNIFDNDLNKKIKILNRQRFVQRLRQRFRTWTAHLVWCQINSQLARADIFSFLIREAIIQQQTFKRNYD